MNKIICNICGTSYPENASQCPICGFARSVESVDSIDAESESSYQYVKGGRFSKANVKKRNQSVQKVVDEPDEKEYVPKSEPEKKGNAFMVVVVIILLLAIIAVVGYIALRFFLPNNFIFEGLDNIKASFAQKEDIEDLDEDLLLDEPEAVPEEEMDTSKACIELLLDSYFVNFEDFTSTQTLVVTVKPADTTDEIFFESSDESVCTISDEGVITPVGEGEAVIIVTCGDVTAECNVTCVAPVLVEELKLNRKEITFTTVDDSWDLYDGQIPVTDITWTSDDESIATIAEGKVVAVSNGDTTVHATFGDQTVSCTIHCTFEEASETTEPPADAGNKTYSLHNPNGYSEDVTLKVGESFTLLLVDQDKNSVKDAQWSVDKESVCSYTDGTVKALQSGTAKINATYNGKTYTCIVRVK